MFSETQVRSAHTSLELSRIGCSPSIATLSSFFQEKESFWFRKKSSPCYFFLQEKVFTENFLLQEKVFAPSFFSYGNRSLHPVIFFFRKSSELVHFPFETVFTLSFLSLRRSLHHAIFFFRIKNSLCHFFFQKIIFALPFFPSGNCVNPSFISSGKSTCPVHFS